MNLYCPLWTSVDLHLVILGVEKQRPEFLLTSIDRYGPEVAYVRIAFSGGPQRSTEIHRNLLRLLFNT